MLLGEAADIEVFDPYFTIDIDVYVRPGRPPSLGSTKSAGLMLGHVAFETSPLRRWQSCSSWSTPASVHYIRSADVDRMLLRIPEHGVGVPTSRDKCAVPHRARRVLSTADSWMEEARAALAHVPDHSGARRGARFLPGERALSRPGRRGAQVRRPFLPRFGRPLVRCVASFLFAAHREFEPSDRMLSERIAALSKIPEGFMGMLDSFMRPIGEVTKDARREIAEHIVRSLMPLAVWRNRSERRRSRCAIGLRSRGCRLLVPVRELCVPDRGRERRSSCASRRGAARQEAQFCPRRHGRRPCTARQSPRDTVGREAFAVSYTSSVPTCWLSLFSAKS